MAFNNGFNYRRAITINNTKVSGSSDLDNFPVLISGTYSYLKDVANGGKVEYADGRDIIYTSDALGDTLLDFEHEKYVDTTGDIKHWVRIPTLSYSSDTTIYMFYGKTPTGSLENLSGTWTGEYKGVWHMDNQQDSTQYSHGFVPQGALLTPIETGSTIGYGQDLVAATSDYGAIGDDADFRPSLDFTIDAIIKIDYVANGVIGAIFQSASNTNPPYEGIVWSVQDSDGGTHFETHFDFYIGGTQRVSVYGLLYGTFYHLTAVRLNTTPNNHKIYVNGVPTIATTSTGAINYDAGNTVSIGYDGERSATYFDGIIDEVRFTTNAWSHDRIITNYNTMSSPSTFYGVGVENSTIPSGYDYKRKITVDNTKVSGTSDITDFPVLVAGTYSYLKDTGNGGEVTSSSGYDIEFSSDSAGLIKLDHEIEEYVNTSGKVAFWVRIPTLDYNNDTEIYMWYKNSSITTSQENVNAVWDSNYVAVWHFNTTPGGADDLIDSTQYGNDGTTVSMAGGNLVDGSVGKAYWFDGGSDYINVPTSTSLQSVDEDITCEAFVEGDTEVHNNGIFWFGLADAGQGTYTIITATDGDGWYARLNGSASEGNGQESGGSPVIDTLYHAISKRRWSDGNFRFTVNKGLIGQSTYANQLTDLDTNSQIGVYSISGNEKWYGLIEEVRISSAYRSDGYNDTVYDNYTSPSTFYGVGAEQPAVDVTGTHIFGDEGLVA